MATLVHSMTLRMASSPSNMKRLEINVFIHKHNVMIYCFIQNIFQTTLYSMTVKSRSTKIPYLVGNKACYKYKVEHLPGMMQGTLDIIYFN